MASQTSLNRVRSYSRVLGKNCTKPRLLILVLCLLTALFYCFNIITLKTISNVHISGFITFAEIVSIAAALSGVLLMPSIFKELYNRQFADVEFSLPLSSSERFGAKLLIILKYHIIPFAFSHIVILAVGMICLPGEEKAELFSLILLAISRLFFVDAISLVCISCCGCIAECIYTPFLLGAAITLIPVCFFEEFVITFSSKITDFDYHNNPFGFIGAFRVFSGRYSDDSFSVRDYWLTSLISIVLSLGLLFLAYKIYKKRDGLSVGKPFVFRSFARIFTVTVTLATILLFFLNSLYNSIFFGLMAYLAISFSSNRKKLTLRTIEFSLLGFASCLAVIIIVGFVSFITSGFGYARMPVSGDFDEKSETVITLGYDESEKMNIGYELVGNFSTEKIREFFTEIEAMDHRHGRSFGGNISAYWDILRHGARDGMMYLYGNSASISCYNYETNKGISLTVNLSGEEVTEYAEKLRSRGENLQKYLDFRQ